MTESEVEVSKRKENCLELLGVNKDPEACKNEVENKIHKLHFEIYLQKLKDEIKFNIRQCHELLDLKCRLEIMIKNIQNPMEICQENLYSREKKKLVESEGDYVEDAILFEIESFGRNEEKLLEYLEKLNNELKKLRTVRRIMENSLRDLQVSVNQKECLLMIKSLFNSKDSRDVFEGSIDLNERGDAGGLDNKISKGHNLISKSQKQRNLIELILAEISSFMIKCGNQCFGIWYETNRIMTKRISEIVSAKEKVQGKLEKIKGDISNLSNLIKELEGKINEKKIALEFAKGRVTNMKKGRQGLLELCHDKNSMNLIKESHALKSALDKLNCQLTEMEDTLLKLSRTEDALQNDLAKKNYVLFIEKDKCLCLRKNFPISTFKEARQPYKCNINSSSPSTK